MKQLHNSQPDGVHYLIEFFGCVKEQLDSLPFWRKLLLKAVKDSNIIVLNKHFHRFNPHGITGYLLLSASHISVHTWPEYGYAACDVFSCGGEDATEGILKYIRANVCHEKMSKRKLKRGFRVQTKGSAVCHSRKRSLTCPRLSRITGILPKERFSMSLWPGKPE